MIKGWSKFTSLYNTKIQDVASFKVSAFMVFVDIKWHYFGYILCPRNCAAVEEWESSKDAGKQLIGCRLSEPQRNFWEVWHSPLSSLGSVGLFTWTLLLFCMILQITFCESVSSLWTSFAIWGDLVRSGADQLTSKYVFVSLATQERWKLVLFSRQDFWFM